MSEKQIIKKQQLQFMLANLVAFVIIFSIFGILIFKLIQTSLFSKVNDELLNTKSRIVESQGLNMTIPEDGPPGNPGNYNLLPFRNPLTERPGEANPVVFSPRTMVIIWSAQGEVLNYLNIGQSYYESFIEELDFDSKNLNTVKNISVNNQYVFRTLLFPMNESGGEKYYVQLLINVDGEQNLVDNFGQILVLSIVSLVILSLSASYVLSKRTMRPIINSWERQAEFIENASHELRTPLTIIQNKLEALLRMPEAKIIDKSENIMLALSETRRLSKLTGDLLTLARADSAEMQMQKQPIEIDSLLEQACEPYLELAQLQNKHFSMSLNCEGKIQGDQGRLHQLLVILLDNALKYTRAGDGIVVTSFCMDNKVVIEVRDTGIGISEEGTKRVFERFYREDKARSRANSGVGLGLAIASWIVSQHQATIQIRQNQPKGTIVTMKFPKDI